MYLCFQAFAQQLACSSLRSRSWRAPWTPSVLDQCQREARLGSKAGSSASPPSSPPAAWGCLSPLSEQELLPLTLQF